MASDDQWLEQLTKDLDARSEAIKETLEDVKAVVSDSSAVAWLDRRDEPNLTVYVIAAGVLHRLIGKREDIPEPGRMDESVVSTCEYTAVPVAEGWSHSLVLTRTVRRYDGPSKIARRWTFEGRSFGPIIVDDRPGPSVPSDPAATSFARALAAAITNAEAHPQPKEGA
jgi:hypothetical protein